jgi:8-oxo-dGTP pyrophosphatase MutT (NUDIX family)
VWPDFPGQFGHRRKFDTHSGVDLYTELDTEVLAVEAGVVEGIYPFTGVEAGSPWWNSTSAVIVQGESGFVLYGEIQASCLAGDVLERGQVLGRVAVPVLATYKGRPQVMLHLELHSDAKWEEIWVGEKPRSLQDPTPFLLEAERTQELEQFDPLQYDGQRFRGVCVHSSVVRIFSEKKVLLLRRGQNAPWFPGQWCFPGGVRAGWESPEETARREVWEETKIRVNDLTLTGEFFAYAPSRVFRVSVLDTQVSGCPRPRLSHEHQGYKWYVQGTPLADVPENTWRLLQATGD